VASTVKLGQNSKQNKLGRQLTDIQIRMRLKASGSRQEIREQYMPMLASKILLPMVENGQVSDVESGHSSVPRRHRD
jgi:replication factor C subunit 1